MKLQPMQCSCGSDWFEVIKLVRPAGFPLPPFYTQLADRGPCQYRYRCADCGAIYGKPSEPKTEVKPEDPKPEDKPAPKKRGRPPKNANDKK